MLPKPSLNFYAQGTIPCNVKRIDSISNVGIRSDMTILKPANFLVPTTHKQHPVQTLPYRPRYNSRHSSSPALHPAPTPRKEGKQLLLASSPGALATSGQCSGLHAFHKEASIRGGESR